MTSHPKVGFTSVMKQMYVQPIELFKTGPTKKYSLHSSNLMHLKPEELKWTVNKVWKH